MTLARFAIGNKESWHQRRKKKIYCFCIIILKYILKICRYSNHDEILDSAKGEYGNKINTPKQIKIIV